MEPKYVEDKNAGTVNIPKIDTVDAKDYTKKDEIVEPVEEIKIIPGKKVNVIGIIKDTKGTNVPVKTTFSISQALPHNIVSVLGPNGLILYVNKKNIKYI